MNLLNVSRKSLPLAVGWMCIALASFLLMAIAGRELSREMGPAQIVACRNIICLAVLVAILARLGWAKARTAKPGRHVIRNAIHFAAQFAWFYAIARIPIAEVFAIEFTAPIWTALLAAVFLGERLNAVRIGAIALGFTGVLVILRPGMAVVDPAALAALAAAFGYACTYIYTKDLVDRDGPFVILLWMNAVQLPLALAFSATTWVIPSDALWPWVATIGLTGLVSHYSLSSALAAGEATIVVPIDFLRLPLAAGVAWLLYGEAVGASVFIGAAIIFAGVLLNLRRG
jgi:drug/metabolite transporter (DMT)-like permease